MEVSYNICDAQQLIHDFLICIYMSIPPLVSIFGGEEIVTPSLDWYVTWRDIDAEILLTAMASDKTQRDLRHQTNMDGSMLKRRNSKSMG